MYSREEKKYEGAKLDENYFRHSDGSSKCSAMVTGEMDSNKQQPRHFIYCDASLIDNKGHYANSCRHIIGEARRRGTDAVVLSSQHIEASLAQELGARPHFALPGWVTTSSDPLCGWMESSFALSDSTRSDLDRLEGLGASDVLYWNTAGPSELKALIDWMQARFTPENCPRVAVEFGYAPGVTKTSDDTGVSHLNLTNQKPYLYRFAIRRLKPEYRGKLVLGTFDTVSSRDYAELLGCDVTTFPLAQRIEAPSRLRSANQPLIVSFLGHQRPDKGFHLVPELVPRILQNYSQVRIMVHNGAAAEMVGQTNVLLDMSCNEPRLGVHHGAADGQLWDKLLDLSSLIVLPYQPDRYVNAYSAILAEALARGIPLVVPSGTTMARMLQEYANCGVTFGEWTAPSVFAAINEALTDFERLSQRAMEASRLWKHRHGPDKTLDAIWGNAVRNVKPGLRTEQAAGQTQANGFVALDSLLRSADRKLAKTNCTQQEDTQEVGVTGS